MKKTSAQTTAAKAKALRKRWHSKVARWLEKDFNRLNRERKIADLDMLALPRIKTGPNSRHGKDLDKHLRRVCARQTRSTDLLRIRAAKVLLAYFHSATSAKHEIPPAICTYLERARTRHRKDLKKNHKMERALGLLRSGSGNRGAFSKLHSMSEDASQEAELALIRADRKRAARKRGISTFTVAVKKLATDMDVSVEVIWRIVRRLKREGKITN